MSQKKQIECYTAIEMTYLKMKIKHAGGYLEMLNYGYPIRSQFDLPAIKNCMIYGIYPRPTTRRTIYFLQIMESMLELYFENVPDQENSGYTIDELNDAASYIFDEKFEDFDVTRLVEFCRLFDDPFILETFDPNKKLVWGKTPSRFSID